MKIEVAYGQLQRPGKGEDAVLVRKLSSHGDKLLLAVADGVSFGAGRAAAEWVVSQLASAPVPAGSESLLRILRRGLSAELDLGAESETTVTCGVLRTTGRGATASLRFDYVAIGDSPIWRVVRGGGRYPYQRMEVHGAPYPAETSRVYGALRLRERDIVGLVTVGSVIVPQGEVLVVCSDGIPESEVFVRDPLTVSTGRVALCPWLFGEAVYSEEGLNRVLRGYEEKGVLYDDATIIAARLRPSAKRRGLTSQPKKQGKQAGRSL